MICVHQPTIFHACHSNTVTPILPIVTTSVILWTPRNGKNQHHSRPGEGYVWVRRRDCCFILLDPIEFTPREMELPVELRIIELKF
jgi:hypothetical protein